MQINTETAPRASAETEASEKSQGCFTDRDAVAPQAGASQPNRALPAQVTAQWGRGYGYRT